MPVIKKKPNFFRENYYKVFGTTWFVLGGLSVLFTPENPVGYLYFIAGIGYFVIGYLNRDHIQAYIQWDPENLILSNWNQKPLIYPVSSIDALIISRENLTVKSGAANGTMLDLKGFNEEDINYLQNDFNKYIQTNVNQVA